MSSASREAFHMGLWLAQIHPDKPGDERHVREIQGMRIWALSEGAVQWAALLACGHMRCAPAKHCQNFLPKVPGHLLPALKVPGVTSLIIAQIGFFTLETVC